MTIQFLCNQIAAIEDKESLFLLSSLSKAAGFFSTKGKLLYVVREKKSPTHESIETEAIVLHTHVRIHAVKNVSTFPEDYYSIIYFKGSLEDANIKAFVQLCEIHSSETEQLSVKEFFYSLIELFKLPTEQAYKNAVGLYGELKLLQIAYQTEKVDLSHAWHKFGSNSKFDFSTLQFAVEVKTLQGAGGIINIKHEQIFGETPCILAVVNCEKSNAGETLSELVSKMQKIGTAFNGVDFAINVATELKRISKTDYENERFNFLKLRMFDAEKIEPFDNIPDRVSELKYRLDITDIATLSAVEVGQIFSKLVQ